MNKELTHTMHTGSSRFICQQVTFYIGRQLLKDIYVWWSNIIQALRSPWVARAEEHINLVHIILCALNDTLVDLSLQLQPASTYTTH